MSNGEGAHRLASVWARHPRVSIHTPLPSSSHKKTCSGCIPIPRDIRDSGDFRVQSFPPGELGGAKNFSSRYAHWLDAGDRRCLLIRAFFDSSAASRLNREHGQYTEPVWSLAAYGVFVLLPLVVSLVLVSTGNHRAMATGAGVACGHFSLVLLLSPFMLFSMFMIIGLSSGSMGARADPGLVKSFQCLLAFLALGVWIGGFERAHRENSMGRLCCRRLPDLGISADRRPILAQGRNPVAEAI